MPVISGNISGSIKSVALNISSYIKSIGVVNRSGGAITVNIGVMVNGTDNIYAVNFQLAAFGSTGASGYIDCDILVPADTKILIVSGGSCDYYLTIN